MIKEGHQISDLVYSKDVCLLVASVLIDGAFLALPKKSDK